MRSKILLHLVMIFFSTLMMAQQPLFSGYTFDPLFVNPAYAGHDDGLTAGAHFRTQWAGVDGAPVTELVNVHAPIGFSGHAAGILISRDQMAENAQTSVALNYAYRFQTSVGRISAGVQADFTNYTSGVTKLHAIAPDDPALAADIQLNLFNAGFGCNWENEKGFAGIAIPQLLKNQLSELNNSDASLQALQINLIGLYRFSLSDAWQLAPSVLYKFIEREPTQLDLQMHFLYTEKMQFDIGYRNNSTYSAGFRFGFLNAFTIGYMYDYDGSAFGAQSGGSHEIYFGYHLQKPEGE